MHSTLRQQDFSKHSLSASATCGACVAGKYEAAKEGLLKLGDVHGLLQLNVEQQRWEDAFLLLAAHSQLKDQVYLPYAKWLLSQDRCVTNTRVCAT